MLLFLCFLFACLGAGLVLAGVVLAVFLSLLSMGAFSASVLVWLKTRSVATGAKTFWLLMSSVAGVPVGAVSCWLLSRVLHLPLAVGPALALGGVGGAVAGVVTAGLAWWAGRWVLTYVTRTLRPTP